MIYKIDSDNRGVSESLNNLLTKFDPKLLLEKFTGRKINLTEFKIIDQKLGKSASWLDGKGAGVDFDQGSEYVWLCVCHEMAHLILWESPRWDENPKIREILVKNQNYRSQDFYFLKYGYDFRYAIEQTMAFLLQAACEEKAGLRLLKWEDWESTFKENGVLEFTKLFWKPWLKYFKGLNKYSKFDKFILEVLGEYFR